MDPLTVLIAGLVFATILFIVALATDSLAVAWLAALAIIAATFTFAFLDNAQYNDAVDQAEHICFPNVVTHLANEDGKLTYDCANDGRLRIVEVR